LELMDPIVSTVSCKITNRDSVYSKLSRYITELYGGQKNLSNEG